jgi:DNA-binding HxlR family transcriptional regulator
MASASVSRMQTKTGGSWLGQVTELFFRKKASRELIETLTESPKSWKQLEDAMPVSPRTLSQRLKEAQDLGLVDKVVRPMNGHRVYGATPQAKKDLVKSDIR